MLKKTIITGLSIGVLSACAILSMDETKDGKIKYYETDGSMQELVFGKYAYTIGKQLNENDVAGYFVNKHTGREHNIFKYSDEKSFSLINLNGDKPENISVVNKETFNTLGDSNKIKFYEFGKGIIESAIYQSNNGLCNDFQKPQGIKVDFVTNYYPDINKMPNDFFTTFASAKISATANNELLKKSYTITTNDPEIKAEIETASKAKRDKELEADVAKLRSFINHMCQSR